jgi:hypothetical protein
LRLSNARLVALPGCHPCFPRYWLIAEDELVRGQRWKLLGRFAFLDTGVKDWLLMQVVDHFRVVTMTGPNNKSLIPDIVRRHGGVGRPAPGTRQVSICSRTRFTPAFW